MRAWLGVACVSQCPRTLPLATVAVCLYIRGPYASVCLLYHRCVPGCASITLVLLLLRVKLCIGCRAGGCSVFAICGGYVWMSGRRVFPCSPLAHHDTLTFLPGCHCACQVHSGRSVCLYVSVRWLHASVVMCERGGAKQFTPTLHNERSSKRVSPVCVRERRCVRVRAFCQ